MKASSNGVPLPPFLTAARTCFPVPGFVGVTLNLYSGIFAPENETKPARFPVLALVIFILVAFVSAAPFTAYTVFTCFIACVFTLEIPRFIALANTLSAPFGTSASRVPTLSIASDVISIILPTSPIQELFPRPRSLLLKCYID